MSLKVVPFESLGTVSYSPSIVGPSCGRICSLFACHRNYGDILHRLRDIATYWSKIANFIYPTCI